MMYKIRTMVHGAESRTGPVWAAYNDPRLTRVGRVIRKLHLDELPQLWNVIKGDMSLIGPRPERPEFTHRLAQEIPGYLDRLMVLPGVTGLAQVNLPPDTDLESVRRKLVLDLEYIVSAGAWLDFRLLIGTAFRAVGVPGYLATRLTWIRRQVPTDGRVHVGSSRAVAQAQEIIQGKINGHALAPAIESAVPRRAK
jgi:lipopolysaccharide/colanic/teichoic acid biosynthesis glycosyltransferase